MIFLVFQALAVLWACSSPSFGYPTQGTMYHDEAWPDAPDAVDSLPGPPRYCTKFGSDGFAWSNGIWLSAGSYQVTVEGCASPATIFDLIVDGTRVVLNADLSTTSRFVGSINMQSSGYHTVRAWRVSGTALYLSQISFIRQGAPSPIWRYGLTPPPPLILPRRWTIFADEMVTASGSPTAVLASSLYYQMAASEMSFTGGIMAAQGPYELHVVVQAITGADVSVSVRVNGAMTATATLPASAQGPHFLAQINITQPGWQLLQLEASRAFTLAKVFVRSTLRDAPNTHAVDPTGAPSTVYSWPRIGAINYPVFDSEVSTSVPLNNCWYGKSAVLQPRQMELPLAAGLYRVWAVADLQTTTPDPVRITWSVNNEVRTEWTNTTSSLCGTRVQAPGYVIIPSDGWQMVQVEYECAICTQLAFVKVGFTWAGSLGPASDNGALANCAQTVAELQQQVTALQQLADQMQARLDTVNKECIISSAYSPAAPFAAHHHMTEELDDRPDATMS